MFNLERPVMPVQCDWLLSYLSIILGSIGYSVNAKLKCYLKIGNGNVGAGFTNNCKKVSGLLCKSPTAKIAKCSFAKNFKCEKEVRLCFYKID